MEGPEEDDPPEGRRPESSASPFRARKVRRTFRVRSWKRSRNPLTRRSPHRPGRDSNGARARRDEGGPNTFDVLWERFFPEGRDAPRRVRVRAWSISLAVALLITLGGFAGTFAYDLWSTEARLREQRDAERALDADSPPFTGSITYDTDPPENFEIVLDRPLTSNEVETLRKLTSYEAWDFLEPLGGRLIPEFSAGRLGPAGGWSWEPDPTPNIGTAVFTMTLLSSRRSQLSIVDMTPVDISCTDPTATTLVEFESAGQATYPGVAVDLTDDDPTLLISDEGFDQGWPYFARRRIDLGGGLEPGGLRVEAATAGQTCEWGLRARYIDARENTDEVVLRDGDEPFFVEASPERPEQHWIVLIAATAEERIVACHETPDADECRYD